MSSYHIRFTKLADSPKRLKTSVMLKELQRIRGIEDPKERIYAFRKFIPRLQDFSYLTEDEELISVVQEFTMAEERSRTFYEIESLKRSLEKVKRILQEVKPVVSTEAIRNFQLCIEKFEESLIERRRQALSFIRNFESASDQVTRQLIGRRLEKEIVPDLAKKLGYTLRPNILPSNGKEIEVDFLGEKDTTTSPFGTGRLRKKEILIAECKTTISKNDIIDFLRKINVIKSKYKISASAFKYELRYEVWIFSCYGWTEELKNLAIKNGITPFDEDAIEEILRRHSLLDRRMRICP